MNRQAECRKRIETFEKYRILLAARIRADRDRKTTVLDAIELLNKLADSSESSEAFWILSAAAAYLFGSDTSDRDGSTVAYFLGDPERPRK